ncbi:MAG: extracellular solute-binding protein [Treponema sp.]|jgi:multiple sugar transport system substrate-binding protein|nr:extracellular solute-binding protein [Treponema sp.]
MATIKDIAQLAGVSQGTVSHVLNGKGIVSSEKIKLVEEAVAQLGYVINERARILRKGRGNSLVVILPNIRSLQYVDFYVSFKAFAEKQGYPVVQYISNDDPNTEKDIFTQIRSGMAAGVAVFSCLRQDAGYYRNLGFKEWELLFVERDQAFPVHYIGFDYQAAGRALASEVLGREIRSLALVTDNREYSNENDFYTAFTGELGRKNGPALNHTQTSLSHAYQSVMQLLGTALPQGIVSSNYGLAPVIRDVERTFYQSVPVFIAAVSPLFTMPEYSFFKYELNYRLMGKTAAQQLIENIKGQTRVRRTILPNTGFRRWYKGPVFPRFDAAEKLHVLTLENPTAETMKHLSRIFTRYTGIEVHISIFSYDELHEVINTLGKSSIYDVLRMDVTWLPWFSPKILRPLDDIDPEFTWEPEKYIEGLNKQYFLAEGRFYTLPVSPSTQMLFYRKDLFESTSLKRLYYETNKALLVPPQNFTDYNRIARFFTRAENPHSPVLLGSTLTMGSTGVAATEFLTRYFSFTDSLFDDSGRLLLQGKHALRALKDLIELKSYTGEQYSNWWTNAAQEFSRGDAAMTILYSNFASAIFSRDSQVINKVGYALAPGRNPIIGGGSLGVSKYSKHPREALAYIRWFCDEPVSSARTLLGSVPPCRESFDNYEIIDAYPWLELSGESFSRSNCRRTPSGGSAPFDERYFLSILGLEVKNAVNGAVSPEKALENAQASYEAAAAAITGTSSKQNLRKIREPPSHGPSGS